jgi:hypothetical protein
MIDYEALRNKYRPERIKTLLIGEAPPPNGKTFFYLPKEMSRRPIEDDASLPATIFNNYFGKRPDSIPEYSEFLLRLKDQGVYLIDIIDEPKKIRGNKQNECDLVEEISDLETKIAKLGIALPQECWIFLLARNSYKKKIRECYPSAQMIRWKDFRLPKETHASLIDKLPYLGKTE